MSRRVNLPIGVTPDVSRLACGPVCAEPAHGLASGWRFSHSASANRYPANSAAYTSFTHIWQPLSQQSCGKGLSGGCGRGSGSVIGKGESMQGIIAGKVWATRKGEMVPPFRGTCSLTSFRICLAAVLGCNRHAGGGACGRARWQS